MAFRKQHTIYNISECPTSRYSGWVGEYCCCPLVDDAEPDTDREEGP